jgi:hypothetical protein
MRKAEYECRDPVKMRVQSATETNPKPILIERIRFNPAKTAPSPEPKNCRKSSVPNWLSWKPHCFEMAGKITPSITVPLPVKLKPALSTAVERRLCCVTDLGSILFVAIEKQYIDLLSKWKRIQHPALEELFERELPAGGQVDSRTISSGNIDTLRGAVPFPRIRCSRMRAAFLPISWSG